MRNFLTLAIALAFSIMALAGCKKKQEESKTETIVAETEITPPAANDEISSKPDFSIIGTWVYIITPSSFDLWKASPPIIDIDSDSSVASEFYETAWRGVIRQTDTYQFIVNNYSAWEAGRKSDENKEWILTYDPDTKRLNFGKHSFRLALIPRYCDLDIGNKAHPAKFTASSTLAPQGKINYDVANLGNSNRSVAWCEGVEGHGIGERINMQVNTSANFTTLTIVNGYVKNQTTLRNNSSAKTLRLYVNGELRTDLHLSGSMYPQRFTFPESFTETDLSFEILEVYPGKKFEDACITSITLDKDPLPCRAEYKPKGAQYIINSTESDAMEKLGMNVTPQVEIVGWSEKNLFAYRHRYYEDNATGKFWNYRFAVVNAINSKLLENDVVRIEADGPIDVNLSSQYQSKWDALLRKHNIDGSVGDPLSSSFRDELLQFPVDGHYSDFSPFSITRTTEGDVENGIPWVDTLKWKLNLGSRHGSKVIIVHNGQRYSSIYNDLYAYKILGYLKGPRKDMIAVVVGNYGWTPASGGSRKFTLYVFGTDLEPYIEGK